METDVKIFEFEHKNFEILFLDGEPLFNPYHVGNCLDLSENTVRRHIAEMDTEERIIVTNLNVSSMNIRPLASRGEVFLREPGLYQLIFKSRKPEAQKFVKWVTHEVLPKLRQNGIYSIQRTEHDQLLGNIIDNTEKLLGIRKREIAVSQNESYNMKLARLIWDCSKNKMGSVKDLYNEVMYLFAAETGFNIEEIAETMGLTRRDYLLRNPEIAKTLYEFACDRFYADSRQVLLIPFDQRRLSDFESHEKEELEYE